MKRLSLFLFAISVLQAHPFRSFRVGSTYAWGFQRANEKTGTFFGVIPISAVLTYDDNTLFPTQPLFTVGFQFGYAMNTFHLRNTDGTRYYTDVSYLIFSARAGLHYSVLNLITVQAGAMPYLAGGFGVGKPEEYLANDWPGMLFTPGLSGYISLSLYPLRSYGEFQNLGIYIEYAPGLAQISAGFSARTGFAGQSPAAENHSRTAQRNPVEDIEQLIAKCDYNGYQAVMEQNPLTQVQVNGALLLHQAAQNGCIPVLKDLIDKGFDTEQLNPNDETPIFTAIRARKIEAVRVLVKAKANLNHTNSDEQTPLALAKSQKFPEAVKVLRAAGAKR